MNARQYFSRLASTGFPISFITLALGALGNSIFLIEVAHWANGKVASATIVLWSAFFFAGATIAPIESFRLYSSIRNYGAHSILRIFIFCLIPHLVTACTLSFILELNPQSFTLILVIGLLNSMLVISRPLAIKNQAINSLAMATLGDGIFRALAMWVYVHNSKSISIFGVLCCYVAGSLWTSVLLIKFLFASIAQTQAKVDFPMLKFVGFAIIGSATSLSVGALPYLVAFFSINGLSQYLTFFTFSRMLLLFQSALLIVFPKIFVEFGRHLNTKNILRYGPLILLTCFASLIFLKKILNSFHLVTFDGISILDIGLMSTSLVTGACYLLLIAEGNATKSWGKNVSVSVLIFILSVSMLVFIRESVTSFFIAAQVPPMIGIILLMRIHSRSSGVEGFFEQHLS